MGGTGGRGGRCRFLFIVFRSFVICVSVSCRIVFIYVFTYSVVILMFSNEKRSHIIRCFAPPPSLTPLRLLLATCGRLACVQDGYVGVVSALGVVLRSCQMYVYIAMSCVYLFIYLPFHVMAYTSLYAISCISIYLSVLSITSINLSVYIHRHIRCAHIYMYIC